MKTKKTLSLTLSLLYMFLVNSQDLSGHWETAGKTKSLNFYVKFDLKKSSKGTYSGTTFDEQATSKGNYKVEGTFDTEKSVFNAENTKKQKGSKNHKPSSYKLTYLRVGAFEYLVGTVRSVLMVDGRKKYSSPQSIRLKRLAKEIEADEFVSGSDAAENEFDFDEDEDGGETKYVASIDEASLEDEFVPDELVIEENETIAAIEKPIVKKPVVVSPKVEPEIEDVTDYNPTEEEFTNANTPAKTLDQIKNEREEVLSGTFRTGTAKVVTLNIRDYGEEDNDIITIFHNNKLVVGKLRATRAGDTFEIALEKGKVNKIYFAANSLGDIPPNTTRIRLDIGYKSYFKKLSVDEQSNAVIELIP